MRHNYYFYKFVNSKRTTDKHLIIKIRPSESMNKILASLTIYHLHNNIMWMEFKSE